MRDVVLVTGVSSGVGYSLAAYLSQKYHVVAVARKEHILHNAFKDNNHVTPVRIDLSDPVELMKGVDSILDKYPYIPFVINNAGVMVNGNLEALQLDEVQATLQVNCLSPLYIMQRTLPAMKTQNFGRVINVTSGAPLNCFPGYGAYSASKGALNTFSVTAARECADFNIKINLMSPGPVRSNMSPDSPMDPSVCHPTVDYLLNLDQNGPTGRFFWLGYEIPLFPDLTGIQWLEGKADDRYKRIL